jgi:hypothetical protein
VIAFPLKMAMKRAKLPPFSDTEHKAPASHILGFSESDASPTERKTKFNSCDFGAGRHKKNWETQRENR